MTPSWEEGFKGRLSSFITTGGHEAGGWLLVEGGLPRYGRRPDRSRDHGGFCDSRTVAWQWGGAILRARDGANGFGVVLVLRGLDPSLRAGGGHRRNLRPH